MQSAAEALRELGQAIGEELVIVVSEEARLAVVAALEDVNG